MATLTQISERNSSAFDRILAVVDSYKADFARYRNFRSMLNEMNALGDRELADLGLRRSELRRVAYQAAYEVI